MCNTPSFSVFGPQSSNDHEVLYSDEANSSTNTSSSDSESSLCSPTQILSIAIRKRRELYEDKDGDLRRGLLHTSMIRSLCKHLGESRAKRRRSRRNRSKSQKRRWDVVMSKNENGLPLIDSCFLAALSTRSQTYSTNGDGNSEGERLFSSSGDFHRSETPLNKRTKFSNSPNSSVLINGKDIMDTDPFGLDKLQSYPTVSDSLPDNYSMECCDSMWSFENYQKNMGINGREVNGSNAKDILSSDNMCIDYNAQLTTAA